MITDVFKVIISMQNPDGPEGLHLHLMLEGSILRLWKKGDESAEKAVSAEILYAVRKMSNTLISKEDKKCPDCGRKMSQFDAKTWDCNYCLTAWKKVRI